MNKSTTKYCTKGNHYVERKLFYKRKLYSPDGLDIWCNKCRDEYSKERKLKIKEGTIKAF